MRLDSLNFDYYTFQHIFETVSLGLSADANLSITADNSIDQLFLNGLQIPPSQMPNSILYRLVDIVPLPDTTRVIAVRAWNNNQGAGLCASDTNGCILTSNTWK